MANRKPINTSDGYIISGIPEGTSDEDLKAFYESIKTGGKEPGEYSFGRPESIVPQTRTAPGQDEAIEDPNAPKTTLSGMVDSFNRGLTPALAAGATGALVGSVVPGFGTITGATAGFLGYYLTNAATPAITKTLNKVFDTELVDSKQVWTALFDDMGVQNPDTAAEQVAQSTGESIADTVAMIVGANAMKGGVDLGSTLVKDIGKMLSYKPVGQVAGAAASPTGAALGGAGGENLAEALGAGEKGQAYANMAGQLIGGGLFDAAATGIIDPYQNKKIAQVTPVSSKSSELLQAGGEFAGPTADMPNRPEITNTELMAKSFPTDKAVSAGNRRRQWSGDVRQLDYDRYAGNQKILADEMSNYGIEVTGLGRTDKFSEELMDDFLTVRQDKLNTNVTSKREIIDKLIENGPVPTTKTGNLLDQLSANEMELSIAANPALGMQGSEDIAKMWVNLKEELVGKNFDQIETIRKRYMKNIKDQNMPDETQQQLRDVYRELVGGYDPKTDKYVLGDLGEFIKENGTEADYNQFRVANKNLAGMANEFNDKALFNLLEEGQKNPENIRFEDITSLLTSKNATDTQKLYDRLSPEGQGLADTAMMSHIFQKIDPSDMSPTVFASEVQKYGDNLGIVMDDEKYDRLVGMKKFFEMSAPSEARVRSGTSQQGVQTGQMAPGTGPAISQGMKTVGPVGLLISNLGMNFLGKFALKAETPRVRDLMASMANVRPGSEAEAQIFKRIQRIIGAVEPEKQGEE